jgi:hypothetical protein
MLCKGPTADLLSKSRAIIASRTKMTPAKMRESAFSCAASEKLVNLRVIPACRFEGGLVAAKNACEHY